MRPPGRAYAAVLMACLIVLLFLHARSYNYVVDDAYISYRYARNLTEGNGLVFNPGERVEGYTNFLWVIFTAVGMETGLDPVLLSKALGFIFAALTLVILYLYAGRVFGLRGPLRLLPGLLTAVSPAFAVWTLAGLETAFFAFLVTLAVLAHLDAVRRGRTPLGSSVALLLAALTRPEGLLVAAVLFIDLLRRRPGAAGAGLWLLPLAAGYVPYFIWRYAYYGFLLPNTFYAKTGGGLDHVGRGLLYVRDFFVSPGGWVYLFALVPLLLGRDRRAAALAVCAAWTGYVILVGGDGLAMYRFMVPIIPLLFLLAAGGAGEITARLSARWGTRAGAAVLACIIVAGAVSTFYPSISSPERDFVMEDRLRVQGNWVPIGKWLRGYARPGESLAVTAAGALPYYSGLYTTDMLGINDVHIAHRRMPEGGGRIAGHEKYDMDYVLGRRPTYIFHYPFFTRRPVITRDQFVTEWNPGMIRLFESEDFRRDYEPVSEKFGDVYLNFFRLKKR
jgi:arabinofuranosyltransferase